MSITSIDQEYVARTYGRFPVELVSGKGSVLTDTDGKTYIDMGSGIGVSCFGFGDELWIQAVTQQLNKLQHTSNLYYTEAKECAIKVARKYSAEKKGADCYTIVTLVNSFHGRTLTTLAATGQEHFHKLFQPLTPGFVHVEANNIAQLTETVNIAGIMLECVQGEGGVLPLTAEYLQAAQKLADEQDIPLIIDEVQTGNGRTGKLYAYMNFDLHPDIVSTAKGLGGGLPIGACLMGQKVENVLGAGDHGSTYGGNPVCCAGALQVIQRLNDDFLLQVREKSAYIFSQLQGAEGIESVSGMGLMVGIKTVKPAKDVVMQCMQQGVLCLTAKDKVRLLPALNIPMEQLQNAIAVIKKVCKE